MLGIMHVSSAPCHYSILNRSVLNMNIFGYSCVFGDCRSLNITTVKQRKQIYCEWSLFIHRTDG